MLDPCGSVGSLPDAVPPPPAASPLSARAQSRAVVPRMYRIPEFFADSLTYEPFVKSAIRPYLNFDAQLYACIYVKQFYVIALLFVW